LNLSSLLLRSNPGPIAALTVASRRPALKPRRKKYAPLDIEDPGPYVLIRASYMNTVYMYLVSGDIHDRAV
jgi:hypothetical protein